MSVTEHILPHGGAAAQGAAPSDPLPAPADPQTADPLPAEFRAFLAAAPLEAWEAIRSAWPARKAELTRGILAALPAEQRRLIDRCLWDLLSERWEAGRALCRAAGGDPARDARDAAQADGKGAPRA